MTTPDYRVALAHLLEAIEVHVVSVENPEAFEACLGDARALLAAPEAVEVADEDLLGLDELEALWNAQADRFNEWTELGIDEIIAFAQQQAVTRYGTARPAPVPVGEPIVPIAERWPDEEDLPCWWMVRSDDPEFKGEEAATPTHWSSHSALMALNGRRARAMIDAEEEKQ